MRLRRHGLTDRRHLIDHTLDLFRRDQCLVESVAGIIGLAALQIAMSAPRVGQHRERSPFHRQALAKLLAAHPARHERFVAAALQEMVAEPILQIGIEHLRPAKAELALQILQGRPHELVAAGRRGAEAFRERRLRRDYSVDRHLGDRRRQLVLVEAVDHLIAGRTIGADLSGADEVQHAGSRDRNRAVHRVSPVRDMKKVARGGRVDVRL